MCLYLNKKINCVYDSIFLFGLTFIYCLFHFETEMYPYIHIYVLYEMSKISGIQQMLFTTDKLVRVL